MPWRASGLKHRCARVCPLAMCPARRGRFRREQDRRVGRLAAVEAGAAVVPTSHNVGALQRAAPPLRVLRNAKTPLDLKSGKATR